jgi:hypothetical protein
MVLEKREQRGYSATPNEREEIVLLVDGPDAGIRALERIRRRPDSSDLFVGKSDTIGQQCVMSGTMP